MAKPIKRAMNKRDQDKALEDIFKRMKQKAKPFADVSPAACKARRDRARVDFNYFCRTYLPHYFDTELSPFHKELAALTEIKGTPVACTAARGHGKTTTIKAKGLSDIVFERVKFIVLISGTLKQAEKLSKSIRMELEANLRIRADFGNLSDPSGSWSAGEFVTKTDTMVMALGRGQGIRGASHGPHRPDLVILDDLEDDTQAKSTERVAEVLAYVKEVIIPGLKNKFQWSLLWFGTILAKNSALDQILNKDKDVGSEWIRKVYPAILPDGKALCPDLHSIEDLARTKRLVGSVAFNKEYLHITNDPNGLFREEWLGTYRPAAMEAELSRGVTVGFIDPSVGAGQSSDYKAFIVITLHPSDGKYYVRYAWIRKASIDAMIAAVYEGHKVYDCVKIGLEDVAFSALLFRDFDAAAKRLGHYLPVTSVKQSINKEMRIASISPLNERGLILYPEGWPGDLKILKEQKLSFPSKMNDDGPDAEEGAIRLTEIAVKQIGYIPLASRRFARGIKNAVDDVKSYLHTGRRGGGW